MLAKQRGRSAPEQEQFDVRRIFSLRPGGGPPEVLGGRYFLRPPVGHGQEEPVRNVGRHPVATIEFSEAASQSNDSRPWNKKMDHWRRRSIRPNGRSDIRPGRRY